VALVGFGRLTARVWPAGDQFVVRPVVHASLAGDHRALDGYRGSVFLAEVERLLQAPEKL
jgi:pyruvate dehydrogenase E2 component (dihydrolipoamide acetyltransferase)